MSNLLCVGDKAGHGDVKPTPRKGRKGPTRRNPTYGGPGDKGQDDKSRDGALPPPVKSQLGRRLGGYRKAQLHPEAARIDGQKGGRAFVERHPEVRTSAHGRRLALAKKGRFLLGLIAEEHQRRD